MAAFDRPQTASYEDHETVWVDTEDHEDHTFCGIMFPIKAKKYLPVERIVIHSISVRGRLGPVSVFVSNDPADTTSIPLEAEHWTQIYSGQHKRVRRGYCKLELPEPLIILPGQVRLIYVHSTLDGDESIVYDDSSSRADRNIPRYQDDFISIHTGKAHLSPEPFGQSPIWGWGNAWRDRREFVGQIEYGVVYKLWDLESHVNFGGNFRNAVFSMLCAQRRYPVGKLPDECLYYIFNMCKWDWFQDTGEALKQQYRKRKEIQNMESPTPTARHQETQQDDTSETAHTLWERHIGYRADSRVFQLETMSSDEEEEVTAPRHTWFRRQFARIHVYAAQQQEAPSSSDEEDGDYFVAEEDDDDEAEFMDDSE